MILYRGWDVEVKPNDLVVSVEMALTQLPLSIIILHNLFPSFIKVCRMLVLSQSSLIWAWAQIHLTIPI